MKYKKVANMIGLKWQMGDFAVPVIIVLCVAAGIGSMWVTKVNDGFVEQTAEAILKSSTGVDIDFSP